MNNFAVSKEIFEKQRQIINHTGQTQAVVVSGSMQPVIKVGQIITIEKIESVDHLRPFDIVVFWDERILTCHYLLKIQSLRANNGDHVLLTKGLWPIKSLDLPVLESHVLGRAQIRIPWFYKLRETILTPRD